MTAARSACWPIILGLTAAIHLVSPAAAQRADRQSPHRAGVFDYYALVLSWSPTYCASVKARDDDPQCNRNARPYAFVLHGLWPQYTRGYPEYCPTRRRPFVPRSVINGMLDIMPSPGLVIHEYRKHGTCTGLEPEGYYDLSRRLYERLAIPARFREPKSPFFISPQQVTDAFVRANPGLKTEMVTINCRGSGNRLREVRICFSREGEFRRCGANDRRNQCRARRMYVPPVRAGTTPPAPRGQRAL